MNTLHKKFFIFPLVLLSMLALFHGCSGKNVNENDPAAHFEDAEADVKNDRYLIAIDKFRMIKNKFPYSNYSIQAQLRIADVYFLQESYIEAAAAYETFRDLHPKHEKAGYALFRTGESYYKDIPSTIARDLMSGQKACEAFDAYLKAYPSHEFRAEAQRMLLDAKNKLAEKELYIAQFYIKRKKYTAAKERLEKLIDKYPEASSVESARIQLKNLPPVEKIKE